ncbi:MAG: hypothetical protein QJR14_08775 [Bacillota bacterium]|nr:hypothetical protein [Bacillota bacterium]
MPWHVIVQSGTPLALRPDWAVSLRLPGAGGLLATPPAGEDAPGAETGTPAWLARAADLLEEVYPSAHLLRWRPRPEAGPAWPEPSPRLCLHLTALAAFAVRHASAPGQLARVAQALHRALTGEEASLAPFLAAALGGWVRTRRSLLGEEPDLAPTGPGGGHPPERAPRPAPELWQPSAEGDASSLPARVEEAARAAAAEASGLAWLSLPHEPEPRPVAWFLGDAARLGALLPPAGWRPFPAAVERVPVRVRIERLDEGGRQA